MPDGATVDGYPALSEREKETLRLLLGGHDAKSIAASLGLSVHTVNDRLREARRKLGVSSSREAARRLARHEATLPQFPAHNEIGDAPAGAAGADRDDPGATADRRWSWGWKTGAGIMALMMAAALFAVSLNGAGGADSRIEPAKESVADAVEIQAARGWLALVDAGRWEESWRASGHFFQQKVTAGQWAAMMQTVRQPLGTASGRRMATITHADGLPGAPAGAYTVLQFNGDFAAKRGAVETVTLVREDGGWKVVGYFIR